MFNKSQDNLYVDLHGINIISKSHTNSDGDIDRRLSVSKRYRAVDARQLHKCSYL